MTYHIPLSLTKIAQKIPFCLTKVRSSLRFQVNDILPWHLHGWKFKISKSWSLDIHNLKLAVCLQTKREAIIICLIQHVEADFPKKVSLKILNSGIFLKTFTHAFTHLQFVMGVLIKNSDKCTYILSARKDSTKATKRLFFILILKVPPATGTTWI